MEPAPAARRPSGRPAQNLTAKAAVAGSVALLLSAAGELVPAGLGQHARDTPQEQKSDQRPQRHPAHSPERRADRAAITFAPPELSTNSY